MPGKHLVVKSDEYLAPFKLTELDTIFERMWDMHETISRRAYELFEEGGKIFGRDLDDWLKAESELLHPVNVRIDESEASLRVEAEVPGFNAEELEASVEPHRLIITGKRKVGKEAKEGETTIYSERSAEKVLRVIELPVEVTTEGVNARLKNGVLQIMMAKAAPARKIAIDRKAA